MSGMDYINSDGKNFTPVSAATPLPVSAGIALNSTDRALKGNQKTTLSNTTSETTIVTAAAAIFNDLYGLILANSGGSATKVDIRDDTGGTIRATLEVPAGDTRGFMLPPTGALAQTAVNKNWTAQCSVATTALEVTALFAKNS